MTNLEKLSEYATDSHTRIQQQFSDISPMVSVNQKMRELGVPADLVMLDCLKSGKRILLVLHDQQPDTLAYQFTFKDEDPDGPFEKVPFADVSADTLYGWMVEYFSANAH